MNAQSLIKELESNDVKIWIEGHKVKWDAPKGVITDKVLVQMKEKKTELVMILSDKQRTAKQGIKGKNPKKPEKCEAQGCTNKIMDDPVAQAQRIIQEALDENNKKAKDIVSVVFPQKPVIQKRDVVIEFDTERDESKIGVATCRSPLLLPERCPDISPYLNKIILGDCFNILRHIENSTIDLVLTSPPYANLRNYGCDTPVFHPDQYVDWILPLFDEVYRILQPTGSFILNINDRVVKRKRHPYVYDLICRATRQSSLRLYDVYFWFKKTAMPNGNQKRLNNVTEYLFHFCKDEKLVKWNMDAVREPYSEKSLKRCQYPVTSFKLEVDREGRPKKRIRKVIQLNQKGKVPSNVFSFPTAAAVRGKNHPAAFHQDLPSWFIRALTDEGNLILDPFSGLGTTCLAAKLLNRKYIGIEINPSYHEVAVKRMNSVTVLDQWQKKNELIITQPGKKEGKRCHQG